MDANISDAEQVINSLWGEATAANGAVVAARPKFTSIAEELGGGKLDKITPESFYKVANALNKAAGYEFVTESDVSRLRAHWGQESGSSDQTSTAGVSSAGAKGAFQFMPETFANRRQALNVELGQGKLGFELAKSASSDNLTDMLLAFHHVREARLTHPSSPDKQIAYYYASPARAADTTTWQTKYQNGTSPSIAQYVSEVKARMNGQISGSLERVESQTGGTTQLDARTAEATAAATSQLEKLMALSKSLGQAAVATGEAKAKEFEIAAQSSARASEIVGDILRSVNSDKGQQLQQAFAAMSGNFQAQADANSVIQAFDNSPLGFLQDVVSPNWRKQQTDKQKEAAQANQAMSQQITSLLHAADAQAKLSQLASPVLAQLSIESGLAKGAVARAVGQEQAVREEAASETTIHNKLFQTQKELQASQEFIRQEDRRDKANKDSAQNKAANLAIRQAEKAESDRIRLIEERVSTAKDRLSKLGLGGVELTAGDLDLLETQSKTNREQSLVLNALNGSQEITPSIRSALINRFGTAEQKEAFSKSQAVLNSVVPKFREHILAAEAQEIGKLDAKVKDPSQLAGARVKAETQVAQQMMQGLLTDRVKGSPDYVWSASYDDPQVNPYKAKTGLYFAAKIGELAVNELSKEVSKLQQSKFSGLSASDVRANLKDSEILTVAADMVASGKLNLLQASTQVAELFKDFSKFNNETFVLAAGLPEQNVYPGRVGKLGFFGLFGDQRFGSGASSAKSIDLSTPAGAKLALLQAKTYLIDDKVSNFSKAQ